MTTIDNLMALADATADAAKVLALEPGKLTLAIYEKRRAALRAALTEALAQPIDTSQELVEKSVENVQVQPVTNCRHCGGDSMTICAGQCKARAAQPAREPVAWWIINKTTDEKFVTTRPDDWNNVNWDKHPLYTAPQPAREPLSDDLIKKMYQNAMAHESSEKFSKENLFQIGIVIAETWHGIGGDK